MSKAKVSKADPAKVKDAQEVAAFISRGLTPEQVASKVDLPTGYVYELTRLPEFEEALDHVGGEEAVKRWQEYNLDRQAATSLRTKVRERLNEYFNILDSIAQNPATKPETRFAVIKELLVQAKISEDSTPMTTQELPPSFFTSLAEALKEMDAWEAKKVQ